MHLTNRGSRPTTQVQRTGHDVGARRAVRRGVVPLPLPLALAVLGATAWVAVPAASADSSRSFPSTSEGIGHTRGLDFTASGSASWKGVGEFTVELANDPNATVLEPPANGELVMHNVSSGTYTNANEDKVFVVSKGNYRFKLVTLPDGTSVPDLSEEVKLVVSGTIVGGTGRYARATGSYTEEGLIKPSGPPPTSPDADVTVRFATTGKGELSPNSNGRLFATRFELSDKERNELVRTALPLPLASRSTSLAAGVYTAELPNWRVTFRVPQGWKLNGFDGETIGADNGSFTSPTYSGLVFVDDPVVFDDPALPQWLQSLTIPAHSWLSVATGVTVGQVEPVAAGATGSSFTMRMGSSNPLYRLFFLPSSGAFVPAIPSWTGHVAEFRSTGGHKLIAATGGMSDPRRQLDSQLISVERR